MLEKVVGLNLSKIPPTMLYDKKDSKYSEKEITMAWDFSQADMKREIIKIIEEWRGE